jgi:multiple sugar transport system permease protein
MTDAIMRPPTPLSPKHSAQASRAARLDDSPWTPYWFVAPVVLFLLALQGYPLLRELMLSFTQTSLLSPQQSNFVGVRNYEELIARPDFWNVIAVTGVYTVAWGRRCCSTGRFAGGVWRGRWSRCPGRRRRWRSRRSSPGC